jgi:8-oxo-dGTP pyrophosphatase MutT (NUDIX family)
MSGDQQRGPWMQHTSVTGWAGVRLTVMRDEVTTPGGTAGAYEWVAAPDLVRVAVVVDDAVLLVRQYHYLAGEMLQLPGGGLDAGEDPLAGARREVAEETGYTGGRWSAYGAVYPMPGLTPARVHLFAAVDLDVGQAHPEASEADLALEWLAVTDAAEAVRAGQLGCAASAALVLAIATGR